jgi:hypothetical protein
MRHLNFFYNDKYYESIEDLMIDLDIDEESIESANDFYPCVRAELEPIIKLNADWIYERIDEERFSENGDEGEKLFKLLQTIDFKSIQEKIPKLWYETRVRFTITKADMYEALK